MAKPGLKYYTSPPRKIIDGGEWVVIYEVTSPLVDGDLSPYINDAGMISFKRKTDAKHVQGELRGLVEMLFDLGAKGVTFGDSLGASWLPYWLEVTSASKDGAEEAAKEIEARLQKHFKLTRVRNECGLPLV